MGYATFRNIHIDTGSHTPHEISQAFDEWFDSNLIGLYIYVSRSTKPNGVLDFDGTDSRPWYSEIEDLMAFSQQFPDAIIVVSGSGEDEKDIWKRQYYGGRCRERRMVCTWSKWKDVAQPVLEQQF